MKIRLNDLYSKRNEIFNNNNDEDGTKIFFKWLIDNEKYFDNEAGKFLESLLKNMSAGMLVNVMEMPDSIEKRRLVRQAAYIGDRHHRAIDLLQAIERPGDHKDEISKEWQKEIVRIHQATIDLLFDVVQSSPAEKNSIVFITLCYSCIDELTAALHLAGHYYYVQATAHLRTVIETIDRMDLFKKFPQTIDLWAGDDQAKIRKELRPGVIRTKLGRKNFDVLYSFLSELGTHPTFNMFKARSAVDVRDHTKATVYLSGTPTNHVRLTYFLISLFVASSLLVSVMRIFKKFHNQDECKEIAKQNVENMKNFILHFFSDEFSDDDKKFKSLLDVFDKFLDSLKDSSITIDDSDH